MEKFLTNYEKFLALINAFLKYLGVALIALIVSAITLQVVSRYVFGRPHLWVEEFATYCFIWSVFIGAAYALAKGRHIIVTTVTDFLSPRVRSYLKLLVWLVMLIFIFQALRFGLRQFAVEAPQKTIALPWRLPRRWFYSLPYIISMSSMILTTVYSFLKGILTLRERS